MLVTGAFFSKLFQSCPTLCNSMDCSPWNSPGQNTGMGSLSFLQGIFPTQGLNPGLPHWRRILYQLSHKRSPSFPEEFPKDLLHVNVVLFLMFPPCGTTLFQV